jgi:hypothetical protein
MCLIHSETAPCPTLVHSLPKLHGHHKLLPMNMLQSKLLFCPRFPERQMNEDRWGEKVTNSFNSIYRKLRQMIQNTLQTLLNKGSNGVLGS